MNQCKIKVFHNGKDFIVSPDVMVVIPQSGSLFNDAIFVENDTGRESYKTLFHKLVEYAVLIEKGMNVNKFNSVTLLFITKSDIRLKRLFSDQGLARFFTSYNSSGHLTDVREKLILNAFANPQFSLQISSLQENNTYDFQNYSLSEALLRKNPTWTIFT